MATTSDYAEAVLLRDLAQTFPQRLGNLPSSGELLKAQRALGVLLRALDQLVESLR